MREIKYKYGYGNGKGCFSKIFTIQEIECGNAIDEICDSPLLRDYKVIARYQFTGLTDENGVEVYEGDIVKSLFEGVGVVTFNNDNYAKLQAFHLCDKDGESLNYHYGVSANDECEVIGNIYENPELLEAK